MSNIYNKYPSNSNDISALLSLVGEKIDRLPIENESHYKATRAAIHVILGMRVQSIDEACASHPDAKDLKERVLEIEHLVFHPESQLPVELEEDFFRELTKVLKIEIFRRLKQLGNTSHLEKHAAENNRYREEVKKTKDIAQQAFYSVSVDPISEQQETLLDGGYLVHRASFLHPFSDVPSWILDECDSNLLSYLSFDYENDIMEYSEIIEEELGGLAQQSPHENAATNIGLLSTCLKEKIPEFIEESGLDYSSFYTMNTYDLLEMIKDFNESA